MKRPGTEGAGTLPCHSSLLPPRPHNLWRAITLTVEQPEFGRQVREIRRAQGLSQTDLAGDNMSPSYISLVESGRRAPSVKLARVIAERLGVPLQQLVAPQPREERRTHRLGLVGRLVAARSSQLSGDWEAAHDQLREVIERAGDSEADEVLWEARWDLATTLGHLGRQREREETLRGLLDDPLTEASPLLLTRVSVEFAQALRLAGKLSESVRVAEEAVRSAESLGADPAETVRARVALLSACAESGDWQRAAGIAEELRDAVSALPDGRVKAVALWACAGARYAAGDTPQALKLLDRAVELATPATDLQLSARLSVAGALMRLSAGEAEAAEILLEQARRTTSLLGSDGRRTQLAAASVALSLHRGDTGAALDQAREAEAGLDGTAPLDEARCTVALARAHRAAGAAGEADARYRDAAARYERTGAYRFAVEVWRELSEPVPPGRTGFDPHALVMP
ncbi:helix-turn-helix transcriptional regulator [Streptomyces xinghaiensis]|uniref:helix-turn-helix transcriptional regulator n=1 Tax=Streptomyces xinghaiensis TaxID=1038928 RepID=UPI0023572ECE|nr:helix-turn-helix transcriptional regulator [Streptomyces xinghaiensis]